MSALPPENAANLSKKAVKRPVGVEIFALLFLLAVLMVFGAGYSWLRQNWNAYGIKITDPAAVSAGLPRPEAEAIVTRGSALIGLEKAAPVWIERLAADRSSLSDYFLRIFVSPEYLSGQKTDPAFIADVSRVLTGSPLVGPELAKAAASLGEKDSRLAYINNYLRQQSFTAEITLPDEPTFLRTLTAVGGLPEAGKEIVGLLPITSEARLTGSGARFKLYSDSRLHQTLPVQTKDPGVQNNYTVEWDTRQENPGSHRLALLIQTSDGRGSWIDLADYVVPVVVPLKTGQILAGELNTQDSAWYQLPAQENLALLNVLDADDPLDLELLDLYARTLARTTSLAAQPAALRHKFTQPVAENDTLYVHITASENIKSNAATKPLKIRFKLMPSLSVAIPPDKPARRLAVLATRDSEILIQDENGKRSWQAAEGYTLIDPTARLANLDLTLPDGQKARVASAFSPNTTEYGLYVDAATSQLTLSALAMEGSAANIQVEIFPEDGSKRTINPEEPVLLSLSENRLRLVVTGFDDSQKTYEVNILRPPHVAGYDQTLQKFPFTYRSALWLLHVQHPAWVFAAANTGLSWPDFAAAQDLKDRSLVDAASSPAAWVESGSPVYDGSSWKAADRKVIEYFADPRNFLDAVNIFQFESLNFKPASQTREGIEKILNNSFMAAGNPQQIDYASLLLEAGRQAQISPYFLAAKIIQEMGRQGQSPLSSGSLAGYEGVYNFYNIGSTPNPTVVNGAVINGARFALYGRDADLGLITPDEAVWRLPWQTPDAAIIGGAIWIAERYVRIGQDTLYFQKFDLVELGGFYTHQYAQNIQMAWAEGRRTRTAYAGLGLLEQSFDFKIPVFENMPDQPQALPQ